MSIINANEKFIYIHVPKTAGTSFEHTQLLDGSTNKHYPISHYNGETYAVDINDYYKFSFVRNPYTRYVSAVVNHILNPRSVELDIDDKGLQINVLKVPRTELIFGFSEFTHKQLNENINKMTVLKPQYTFLEIDDIMVMDFVGRFENLQDDWMYVSTKLGGYEELGHHIKGATLNYDCFYTKELRDIVYKAYERDFATFEYGK